MKHQILCNIVCSVLSIFLVTSCFTPPTHQTLPESRIEMVSIPPGSFKRDGIASHITSITQGFIMSRFLVTQGLFAEIMGVNPSHFQDKSLNASHPVEQVNWYHAIAFANKLSLAEGLVPVYTITSIDDWEALTFEQIPTENSSDWNQVVLNWNVNGYRLPTEAEWV